MGAVGYEQTLVGAVGYEQTLVLLLVINTHSCIVVAVKYRCCSYFVVISL